MNREEAVNANKRDWQAANCHELYCDHQLREMIEPLSRFSDAELVGLKRVLVAMSEEIQQILNQECGRDGNA